MSSSIPLNDRLQRKEVATKTVGRETMKTEVLKKSDIPSSRSLSKWADVSMTISNLKNDEALKIEMDDNLTFAAVYYGIYRIIGKGKFSIRTDKRNGCFWITKKPDNATPKRKRVNE